MENIKSVDLNVSGGSLLNTQVGVANRQIPRWVSVQERGLGRNMNLEVFRIKIIFKCQGSRRNYLGNEWREREKKAF